MDAKTVAAVAAVGSFCAAILGGVLAWLLANERRIARLEKGQERLEEASDKIQDAAQALSERLDRLNERLDRYFANIGA